MSSTLELMAGSPLDLSYPEPFRVTGPLPLLVLRAEDMWRKHKPLFIKVDRVLSIQYSVMFVRGNGVIHRGQKPASRG